MDAYLEPEGSEFYCEDCAPKGAECYSDGGGEADCPQHCANCGVPLENPLTSDGVQYVLEAAEEECARHEEERERIMPLKGTGEEQMTYYHGSPHKAIVLDWLEQIRWYNLSLKDKERLERCLDILS